MNKNNKLIIALMLIAIGVLFIFLKGTVIPTIMTIAGVALIIMAVVDYFQKEMAFCITKGVLGVAVILFGWLLTAIALFIIAGLLILFGIIQLVDAIRRNIDSPIQRGISYILPMVSVVSGIFLFFDVDWIFVLSGILLVLEGLLQFADLVDGGIKAKEEKAIEVVAKEEAAAE